MAKKNKLKTADIALTETEVQQLVGEITALQIDHDAELAHLNKELDAVRATHEPIIKNFLDQIQIKTLQVEAWVRANRESFQEPRSRRYPRGEIGLRLGQWAVTTLKGVTQKEAVKRLGSFRWGKVFVRTPDPVLDKEALLKARETIKPERLLAAGLSFEQGESFFFEPNTDEATESVKI